MLRFTEIHPMLLDLCWDLAGAHVKILHAAPCGNLGLVSPLMSIGRRARRAFVGTTDPPLE